MDEELRIAFSKKEKVEQFLAKLDGLKAEGSIEEIPYQDLKVEYAAILKEATGSIKSIKAKLRHEFEKKANELETLQKEQDLLEARFSVGEVRAEIYRRQAKPLKVKVEQLKKEVPKLRTLISATSSAELGGSTKVDIPGLKVKRVPRKPKVGTADKSVSSTAPSKDVELVSELVDDTSKTTVTVARPNISAAEESYVGEKRDKEYPVEGKSVISGTRAAVIVVASLLVVIIVFVVGRMLATLEDHTAPVISGVSASAIGSAVTIEWITDEKSTSQVILQEPEVTSTSTELDKALVTQHSIEVSGVKAGVKYQVTLNSVDARGNGATYEMEQILIPGTQVDLNPPVISSIAISDITDTGVAITWKTDEPATSQVMVSEAGAEKLYFTETIVTLDTNHSVVLVGLKPSVTYAFTLICEDANGNKAMYDLGTMFTTLSSFPVGPEIGKRAPDFTLQTVDGKSLTLGNFRGTIVMVKFWQKACPACVREMPVMQSFLDKLPEGKVVILAINSGDYATDVQDFAERWEIGFPVLLDLDRKVTYEYEVSGTPTTFIIDSQGIIRVIKDGAFANQEEIESAINSMLATGVRK